MRKIILCFVLGLMSMTLLQNANATNINGDGSFRRHAISIDDNRFFVLSAEYKWGFHSSKRRTMIYSLTVSEDSVSVDHYLSINKDICKFSLNNEYIVFTEESPPFFARSTWFRYYKQDTSDFLKGKRFGKKHLLGTFDFESSREEPAKGADYYCLLNNCFIREDRTADYDERWCILKINRERDEIIATAKVIGVYESAIILERTNGRFIYNVASNEIFPVPFDNGNNDILIIGDKVYYIELKQKNVVCYNISTETNTIISSIPDGNYTHIYLQNDKLYSYDYETNSVFIYDTQEGVTERIVNLPLEMKSFMRYCFVISDPWIISFDYSGNNHDVLTGVYSYNYQSGVLNNTVW